MEYLDIVNEADEVVGRAAYADIYAQGLPHRIVHVMLQDDQGRYVIQRRSATKRFCPNTWVTSAGGHVQSGETFEQGAHRELLEELGVDVPLTPLCKFRFESKEIPYKWIEVWRGESNGPFVPSEEEVAFVQHMTKEEMCALLDTPDELHPEFTFILKHHIALL